jgi:hypothetical protein
VIGYEGRNARHVTTIAMTSAHKSARVMGHISCEPRVGTDSDTEASEKEPSDRRVGGRSGSGWRRSTIRGPKKTDGPSEREVLSGGWRCCFAVRLVVLEHRHRSPRGPYRSARKPPSRWAILTSSASAAIAILLRRHHSIRITVLVRADDGPAPSFQPDRIPAAAGGGAGEKVPRFRMRANMRPPHRRAALRRAHQRVSADRRRVRLGTTSWHSSGGRA